MLLVGGGGEWIEKGNRGVGGGGEVWEDVEGGREEPTGAATSSCASRATDVGDS